MTKMNTGNAGSKGKELTSFQQNLERFPRFSVKNEHTHTKQRSMWLVMNVDFRPHVQRGRDIC